MSESLLYVFPPPQVLNTTGVVTFQAAGLFLLAVFAIKYLYRLFFSPLSGFPGPKFAAATKLYETYHVLLKNDWIENLEGLHRRYGPVIRIGPNELHFTDHEFCLQHHKRPDLIKSPHYYGPLGHLLGGLASPTAHAKRKATVQPFFTGSTLAQFSQTTMNDQLDRLHDRLKQDASAGDGWLNQINLSHYLFCFTNDIMMAYVFGHDPEFLKQQDVAKVHDTMRSFGAIDLVTLLRSMPVFKYMLDVFPFLRVFSPMGWIDKLVGTYLSPIISKNAMVPKQEKASPNNSLLENLWRTLGDELVATHEASQAIFIGNESLMSNLTFLLHYLIQNPEMIRKLRTELDTLDIGFYGHRVWADPKIMSLPYLDALCRESNRLSSPSWHRQPRSLPESVDYKGTTIPPMTSMSFTLHLLERDPVLYPNPESYQPDRWLGGGPDAKQARQNSVSVGTGTRTCLGQFLARVVLHKTAAALVYNFGMSLWDESKDRAEGYRYLETYPKKGHGGYMKIKLTPRFAPRE